MSDTDSTRPRRDISFAVDNRMSSDGSAFWAVYLRIDGATITHRADGRAVSIAVGYDPVSAMANAVKFLLDPEDVVVRTYGDLGITRDDIFDAFAVVKS